MSARGQQLDWVRTFVTGSGENFVTDMKVAGDFVYVCGTRVALGGISDGFVGKFDLAGNQVWMEPFLTPAADDARVITVEDPWVYVAGSGFGANGPESYIRTYHTSGIQVNVVPIPRLSTSTSGNPAPGFVDGSGMYGTDIVDVPGSAGDVQVFKYDHLGQLVWVTSFGTPAADFVGTFPRSLTVDVSGVFVTGSTWGAFPGYIRAGFEDAFLARLGSDGSFLWVRQTGVVDTITLGTGVAVDGNNVYASTQSQLFTGENTVLSVSQYGLAGNLVWTRALSSGPFEVLFSAIDADPAGVCVAGGAGRDVFARRFNSAGDPVWTTQFGSTSQDEPYAVALDGAHAYVGGIARAPLGPGLSGGAFLAKLVPPNRPPVADAGDDFAIDENAPGVVDGSASSDADGNALTYSWIQLSGPDATLIPGAGATASFVAPAVSPGGATLTFQLTVSDGITSSTPDTINVAVLNLNRAPSANAGDPQTVSEQALVMLNGTASFDEDGDELGYEWTQIEGPTVALSDLSAVSPTFVAPAVSAEGVTLKFQLQVNDGLLGSTDTVEVHVSNENQPPIADAGADVAADEGTAVGLVGTASDPDGDALSFSWIQQSGAAVVLTGAATLAPSFVAPMLAAGTEELVFRLTVSDGLASVESEVIVLVRDTTAPPDCSRASASQAMLWPPNHKMVPITIEGVGSSIQITITAVTQDEPTGGLGDGDTAVDAVIQANGRVLIRAERSGTGNGRVYRIHFTATDGTGQQCSGSVGVSVPHTQKKSSPAIDSGQNHDSTN